MRTTIDINTDLLTQAQEILKTESKKDTVEKALEQLVKTHKRVQLIKYRGKIDLDIDLDHLRGRES